MKTSIRRLTPGQVGWLVCACLLIALAGVFLYMHFNFHLKLSPITERDHRTFTALVRLLQAASQHPLKNIDDKSVAGPTREVPANPKHFSFTYGAMGRTLKKGAQSVSFTRLSAEDGIEVTLAVEDYSSNRKATTAMSNLIDNADQVIEKGTKKAWDGRRVGERVVINGECTLIEKKNQSIVAWTDGRTLNVLCSQSLRHVLDFEEQAYPASPPVRPGG